MLPLLQTGKKIPSSPAKRKVEEPLKRTGRRKKRYLLRLLDVLPKSAAREEAESTTHV